MANLAQFGSLMGGVEDGIVECFRTGGGVPYSQFPKFQELMASMSADVHDAALMTGTLPLVDGITERLEAGIDVCDIGCGAGHTMNLLAKAFPNSRFTGWDFSEEGIAAATAESAQLGVENTLFEVKDAVTIDGSKKFDFITVFDAIHDQAQPDKVLANIAASLEPDGVFLCVDIAGSSNVEENMEHPLAPMLYGVSTFHCMTVSLALDGAGLGTMWGEQKANEMLPRGRLHQRRDQEDPGGHLQRVLRGSEGLASLRSGGAEDEVGEALALVALAAEQDVVGLHPAEQQVAVDVPGEAHAAVHLDVLAVIMVAASATKPLASAAAASRCGSSTWLAHAA